MGTTNCHDCGCGPSIPEPCITPPPVCPDPQPCTEVIDAQCVVYSGIDIECSGNVIIPTSANIAEALNSIISYICGTEPPSSSNYGLYVQTQNSQPVTNTTTPSSLTGTGVGSLSIPANSFVAGNSFNASFQGHISTQNGHSLRITIQTGGEILADTGVLTLPNINAKNWTLDLDFTIREIGERGTASIASGGKFMFVQAPASSIQGITFSTINNTTFDTTIDNTLEVVATWSQASASDIIYSEMFTLKKTF